MNGSPPAGGWQPDWRSLIRGAVSAFLVALAGAVAERLADVTIPGPLLLGTALAAGIVVAVVAAFRPRPAGPGQLPDTLPHREPRTSSSATGPKPDSAVDRSVLIDRVLGRLRTERVLTVTGPHGTGTSEIALQAANDFKATARPDGAVYLDLSPEGRPLRPRRVPLALGRTAGLKLRRPVGFDDLRQKLGERRPLFLLDNVATPAQLRGFLPAPPTWHVLIVGSPQVAGVTRHGVTVTEPSPTQLVAWLTAGSVEADETVVRDLVDLCGRRLDALQFLRNWIRGHSGADFSNVREHLRRVVDASPHVRVAMHPMVRSLLSRDLAYRAQRPAARRLFRLLSLAPGPLEPAAVAKLAGRSTSRVTRLLSELNLGLVDELTDDGPHRAGPRYQVRGELAAYARMHLHRGEGVRSRVRAQRRLISHFAVQADRHAEMLRTVDENVGRSWFEQHAELLHEQVEMALTVARGGSEGWPPRPVRKVAVHLAQGLCVWYAFRAKGRIPRWQRLVETVERTEVDDKSRLGVGWFGWSRRARAWAANELGVIRLRRGDLREAERAFHAARTEWGSRHAAQAETNLGLVGLLRSRRESDQDRALQDLREAVARLDHARELRSSRDPRGLAISNLALGAAYVDQRDWARARERLYEATVLFEAQHIRRGVAAAYTNRVLAHWHRPVSPGDEGGFAERLEAEAAWTVALELYDQLDDPQGCAAVLLNAGAALVSDDPPDPEAAARMLHESLALRDQWPATPGLARTHLYLGDALLLLGDHRARDHWEKAVAVAEEVGDRACLEGAKARLAS